MHSRGFGQVVVGYKRRRLGALLFLTWVVVTVFFPSGAKAEDGRVLPKGRSRLSVTTGVSSAIDSQYNGSGAMEKIVDKYSMELNSANLSKLAPSFKRLVGLLNNSAPGAGDELTAGYLKLEGSARRQQIVIMEQYGLSDRLSVGVQIPVIRGQVSVRKSLTGVNNAAQLAGKYVPETAPEAKDAMRQIAEASVAGLEAELLKLGYAPVNSYEKSGLGDVAFGGRYAYRQDEVVVASAQLGITAPTGATPKPSELLGMPFGEGAWDVGAAHIVNWSPVHWLVLGQGLHYTYKLANTQLARVPSSPDDFLPGADAERTVRRKMGDKVWATLSAEWKPSSEISLGAAYEWYWRLADRYRELGGGEIELLRSGTHYVETASLQLTYSTIQLFLSHRFPVPANFLVTYLHPVRGKNSLLVPVVTAELALFF